LYRGARNATVAPNDVRHCPKRHVVGLLFGSELSFRQILNSLYGAIWRCSCFRL